MFFYSHAIFANVLLFFSCVTISSQCQRELRQHCITILPHLLSLTFGGAMETIRFLQGFLFQSPLGGCFLTWLLSPDIIIIRSTSASQNVSAIHHKRRRRQEEGLLPNQQHSWSFSLRCCGWKKRVPSVLLM